VYSSAGVLCPSPTSSVEGAEASTITSGAASQCRPEKAAAEKFSEVERRMLLGPDC
jgi:hypothetical protein